MCNILKSLHGSRVNSPERSTYYSHLATTGFYSHHSSRAASPVNRWSQDHCRRLNGNTHTTGCPISLPDCFKTDDQERIYSLTHWIIYVIKSSKYLRHIINWLFNAAENFYTWRANMTFQSKVWFELWQVKSGHFTKPLPAIHRFHVLKSCAIGQLY